MNVFRLLPAVLLGACSTPLAPEAVDLDNAARSVHDGSAEAYGVLALLDHPVASESFLDSAVALDSRAASSLAHHRNGPDGVHGTSDDNPFTTMDEVDGAWYVGNAAIDRMSRYAADNGFTPAGGDWIGAWDDVDFTLNQAIRTVDLANTASLEALDNDLGLDARAAANIVDNGPYSTVAELAAVPYVGTSALEDLRFAASLD